MILPKVLKYIHHLQQTTKDNNQPSNHQFILDASNGKLIRLHTFFLGILFDASAYEIPALTVYLQININTRPLCDPGIL